MKHQLFRSFLAAGMLLAALLLFLPLSTVTAAESDDFVITVKTDNPGSSTDTQFQIPTSGEGYNYNVDCDNDGTNDANGWTTSYTCNYASPGTYTIRIKDNSGANTGFPRISFNLHPDRQKLLTVQQWGTMQWDNFFAAFYDCDNLTITATDAPDLSNVTDMRYAFKYADAVDGDFSGWDVSTITNMQEMFAGATIFNSDISGWDVSSVTDMGGMFSRTASFNQDISGWDIASVTEMDQMFYIAESFNQDISGWNTSGVDNMYYMFGYATAFDQDISSWDVSNVTDMEGMLYDTALSTEHYDALLNGWNAQSLQSGVTFDGGSSTYCTAAAARQNMIDSDGWTITDGGLGCPPANDFVISINTGNPGITTNTRFMIPTTGSGYNYNVDCDNDGTNEATNQSGDYTCNYPSSGLYTIRIKDNTGAGTGFPRIYFNGGGDRLKVLSIDQWGTGKWTSMSNAFAGCSYLNGEISDTPDLSQVTDMSYMFRGASWFNQDISSWDVSNVTNMNAMFKEASAFNQSLNSWVVSSVTTMYEMFSGATDFNQDLNGWNTGNVTNMYGVFYDTPAFNGNITSWNTAKVTDMGYMFNGATIFNQDIGGWDVSSVEAMEYMFSEMENFNQDLNDWNTGSVTNMYAMFYESPAFNGNITSWNVSLVEDMEYMFGYANAFDQDLGGWDVSSVEYADSMFGDITLSTENYDSLLAGWSSLSLQYWVGFDAGYSTYCTAEADRQFIINEFGWEISDGGKQCPVTQPGLTSPANKALVAEMVIDFIWEPSNATRYTLEIKKVSDNSVVYKAFYDAAARCDATACTVPLTMNLAADKYKWHIIPWDDAGTRGPISNWYVFTKKLSTPVLRSPGDGNTIVSSRPTFKWLPVYEATEYVIELLDDGGTRVDIWSWKNPVCGTYCEFRVPAVDALVTGDYQWRVRARNDERASDWSGVYTFTYQ